MPTPGVPSIATRYESHGSGRFGSSCKAAFNGLDGGIMLLLLERLRRNESPRFTMPMRGWNDEYKTKDNIIVNREDSMQLLHADGETSIFGHNDQ